MRSHAKCGLAVVTVGRTFLLSESLNERNEPWSRPQGVAFDPKMESGKVVASGRESGLPVIATVPSINEAS